jgi:ATP-dependent protease ClpP protease subunit
VKTLEVVIHFNSYGGAVRAAFVFIDTLRQIQKRGIKFRSIINGIAASAATLMALVCNERQITRHSHAMIHELSGMHWGNYTAIKSASKHIDDVHNQIVKLYDECRRRTESPAADAETPLSLSEMLLRETWFTAKEYVKMGFVDSVV